MTNATSGAGSTEPILEASKMHRVMVPCPTHTHGHSTIVVTQFSQFAQDRHQNQLVHAGQSSQTQSTSPTIHHQEQQKLQRQPGQSRPVRSLDKAFDSELWRLIPYSMRLQSSSPKSPSPPSSPLYLTQPQRPLLSDTIDRSGTRTLHPTEIDIIQASPSSSDETLSPILPSRKRRTSSPSSIKSSKRASYSQTSSQEPISSPGNSTRPHMDDGNPFKVQPQSYSEIQRPSGLTETWSKELHRSNIIYRSQQYQPYSHKKQPSTPPTLRHRGRSLGPESSGSSSARIDIRHWSYHVGADALQKVTEDIQDDIPPTRESSPVDRAIEFIQTDNLHFTPEEQDSDSQATQTPKNPRRYFDAGNTLSGMEREANIDMARDSTDVLESAKVSIWRAERRPSISSTSTKSLLNDSPISVRTISRRHSIAEIESPIFKTPTRSRRKSSIGRILRDDGSLSSGRINSLPEGSPIGIDWSQSLETPVKKREVQGAAKTPISNVIQRLRGLPTTPKSDENQSLPEEVADWNPSLETPPRKLLLTEKHDISETKISAKVLDELRGLPNSSWPQQPQTIEKQNNLSSQEGSFYSAASSILSDDDDNLNEKTTEERAAMNGYFADRVEESTESKATNTNNNLIATDISPVLSSSSHAVSLLSKHNDDSRIQSGYNTQDPVEETSPIIDSPIHSPVFMESQEAMFEGLTSAEINAALLSRSTQGSHHHTQPSSSRNGEENGAAIMDLSQSMSPTLNKAMTNPIGFRSASGKITFKISDERLRAARRLFESSEDDLASDKFQAESESVTKTLATDMLTISGVPASAQVVTHKKCHDLMTKRQNHSLGAEVHNSESHLPLSPGNNMDDDFDNIRLSQLDDGFNIVPEATQKPGQRSSTSMFTKTTPRHTHNGHQADMSTCVLGDLFDQDNILDSDCQKTHHQFSSSYLGNGFMSASGKKLAAVSAEALAKAASMFGEDFDSKDSMGIQDPESEGIVPYQKPSQMDELGGFSSTGRKSLPQVSEVSQERAIHLIHNSGVKTGLPLISESPGNLPLQVTGGGFSSGSGRKLKPPSKEAMEKWSKLFAEDNDDSSKGYNSTVSTIVSSDAQPKTMIHQLGGFSSGNGKKLAPPSKAALDRWSKEFSEDIDSSEHQRNTLSNSGVTITKAEHMPQYLNGSLPENEISTIISKVTKDKWSNEQADEDEGLRSHHTSEPKQPQTAFSIAHEVAFASATGKALSPVSKSAQARAYGLLELEPQVTFQDSSSSNPSTTRGKFSLPDSTFESGSIDSITTSQLLSPPVHLPISTHMQNLKMKTLRGTSKGRASLPGHMKPILKTGSTPFKSPVLFKSPLRVPFRPPSSGLSNSEVITDNTEKPSREASSVNGSNLHNTDNSKNSIEKRSTLHPTARLALADPMSNSTKTIYPAQSHSVQSFRSIFNLQEQGARKILRDALGLPKRHKIQELIDRGISESILFMTFNQAREYKFNDWGVDDAYNELLLRGATADLLSKVWLSNHYAQVVWKLACYIRTWPEYFISSESLTWFCPSKVLDQLAYRYEREVNRAERPALRKIVEGDETPARHMVLVIASISQMNQSASKEDAWKILVSDGWYTIPAVLDHCLIRAIERGKLKVGSKVHVCRAKLNGAENGVAILDLVGAGSESSTVSIVLQANNTRLARWDARLGFQRTPLVWTKRIQSIVPEGGLVPGLDVIVLRKYPVLYLETLEDGITKIKRTAKEEAQASDAHREKLQQRYHNMVREVEREFATEIDAEGRPSGRAQEEIMMRAQEMQAEATARNVIPFFSVRVGNYWHGNGYNNDKGVREALITFWHSEQSLYQEGHRIRITSLVSKKLSREHGFEDVIQLTGTRMTTAQGMPTEPDAILLTSYRPRSVARCSEVLFLTPGTETDLVLVILAVGDSMIQYSNKVYFVATDASQQLLLVEHQLSSPLSVSNEEAASHSLPSFLKVQKRILMANARFKIRDHKLDLGIISSVQSYTQITTASSANTRGGSSMKDVGWPSYAYESLQKLDDMIASVQGAETSDSIHGKETFEELVKRANAILDELHPSL
ncbi:Breast cancer 2, early onset [Linnemannia zychae]|nr:Breast cancer 2, early onset [Linnemannia zychae]